MFHSDSLYTCIDKRHKEEKWYIWDDCDGGSEL